MNRLIRLTTVLTHPIQYYAPWFRQITDDCPQLELTVLYATQPTPQQQGVGFGQAFEWDSPLTEGYDYRIVRPARPSDNLRCDALLGLNVPEISRALRETRPDVVLLNGWYSITLLRALWTCRRLRVPVLYRGDSHLNCAPAGWRRLPWQAKTRMLLRSFDAALSVGQRTREYLLHFGIPPTRIFDAPHFVDNEFFANSAAPHQSPAGRARARLAFGVDKTDFVVLFVGKLEPVKRLADVIQAVARMGAGVSLLVVGSGSEEEACRKLARQLEVKTAWAGFLNQSELGRAYAAADCLVLGSRRETWGLVVNEAMATGLPCVVSDGVGCAPDLISPGETGEIFPMGDVAELAGALKRLRACRGQDFGAACRRRIARYSVEEATRGLLAACQSVTVRAERPAA